MEFFKQKILNASEIARRIGLSPSLFYRKLYRKRSKRLSEKDTKRLQEIKEELQGWRKGDDPPEFECVVCIEDQFGDFYVTVYCYNVFHDTTDLNNTRVVKWLFLKKL